MLKIYDCIPQLLQDLYRKSGWTCEKIRRSIHVFLPDARGVYCLYRMPIVACQERPASGWNVIYVDYNQVLLKAMIFFSLDSASLVAFAR